MNPWRSTVMYLSGVPLYRWKHWVSEKLFHLPILNRTVICIQSFRVLRPHVLLHHLQGNKGACLGSVYTVFTGAFKEFWAKHSITDQWKQKLASGSWGRRQVPLQSQKISWTIVCPMTNNQGINQVSISHPSLLLCCCWVHVANLKHHVHGPRPKGMKDHEWGPSHWRLWILNHPYSQEPEQLGWLCTIYCRQQASSGEHWFPNQSTKSPSQSLKGTWCLTLKANHL